MRNTLATCLLRQVCSEASATQAHGSGCGANGWASDPSQAASSRPSDRITLASFRPDEPCVRCSSDECGAERIGYGPCRVMTGL